MARSVSSFRVINVLFNKNANIGAAVARHPMLKHRVRSFSDSRYNVCKNYSVLPSRRRFTTKTHSNSDRLNFPSDMEKETTLKEPEQKTVTFEDNDLTVREKGGLTVTGWGHYRFKVNEDFMLGSLILFPTFALSWDIESPNGIKDPRTYRPGDKFEHPMSINELSIDHFNVFQVYRPHQELIIVGTGAKLEYPNKSLLKELRKLANIEIMDTVNACATFNMLSQEGRRVAAALIARPDNRS